jgi:hypothetical protein
MNQTQKIPYGGDEFDHLIEAQWAVFFTWLGIPFKYRKICVKIGRYGYQTVPFHLPEQNSLLFFGNNEIADDWLNLNMKVFIFEEEMRIPERGPNGWERTEDDDYVPLWCECPDCGRLGITGEGRANWLPCKEKGHQWPSLFRCVSATCPPHGEDEESSNPRSPRLIAAYQAAIDFGRMWRTIHPDWADQHEPIESEQDAAW